MATVDDRDAMDKHVDGGDVQDMVAGDGVPLDEGGGTDSIQVDDEAELTIQWRSLRWPIETDLTVPQLMEK